MTHLRNLRTAWRRCPRPRRWVIAAELACYVGEVCGRVTTEAERRVPAYAEMKRLLRMMAAEGAAPLGDEDARVQQIMARIDAERQSGHLRAHQAAAERMATGEAAKRRTNGNGHHIDANKGDDDR